MWEACEAIRNILLELGPSIDGGKDSLSMAAKVNNETVISPGEVTMTLYAPCPDITKTITPDLKIYNSGILYFIDLSGSSNHNNTTSTNMISNHYPLGGTALSTVYNQLGNECSDVHDILLLKRTFEMIQKLIDERLIISGHDRSDGGLIVTLLEMAFAGNCGIEINIQTSHGNDNASTSTPSTMQQQQQSAIEYLFNENLGLVIEILPQNMSLIETLFNEANIPCSKIGKVLGRNGGGAGAGTSPNVSISFNHVEVLNDSVSHLRDLWESTSFALELLQCHENCVQQERNSLLTRFGPTYRLTYDLPILPPPLPMAATNTRPKVAILRQEGTNGDREMSSAFYSVGFDVWDVNMNDLLMATVKLDQFQGIVFCGGFSYADVNGSAKGWAATIRYHQDLNDQFQQFKNRPDTFSLGVCNGCQLMALLGWVPFANTTTEAAGIEGRESAVSTVIDEIHQPRFLHNESQRFESRWCSVKIQNSKSILLKNMESNVLGIWVQHGEGRLTLPDPTQLSFIQSAHLIPLSYVDDDGNPTETYPMNPNGSPLGIAGLCSEDGRHLAMMPHPERCFLKWQWPYQPLEWRSGANQSSSTVEGKGIEASPWIKLFQNAFEFCKQTE
jgi:phosphoribosylformylglycinamidine synthase